jgi:threonine dehydratase
MRLSTVRCSSLAGQDGGVPMVFDHDDVVAALEVVRRFVPPTPQYAWPLLADAAGVEVWVKHENHTPAGAFKVRGGLVFADMLTGDGRQVSGLVAATRGNHGQSVAIAAKSIGVPATIVVPSGNSPGKNSAMRGWGAALVEHGHDFQAALEHARALAGSAGLEFVPSFHPDLVRGVATYAYELLTEVADLDAVYVPVGLGSGICGLIAVRDLLGLRTEIVGVVAAEAPAVALSFAAGRPIATDTANTFMDGVACRVPDPAAIDIILRGAARIVTVSEDQGAEAMRLLYATTRNMPEPAGAVALAGLLADPDRTGHRVAVIQTGGNADEAMINDVLAGRTPRP